MFIKKGIITACALLAFSASAFASVGTGHDEQINYQMDYPIVYTENEAVQDAINKDIYRYLADFRSAYQAGSFISGSISYELKYEDDNFVSMILTDYRYNGGAHGMPNYIGLTYYKKTGQALPLPFFAKLRPADSAYIYGLSVYRANGDKLSESELNSNYADTPISGNYFLQGGGKISLIYQPYDLAAYAAGMTYITMDAQFIDYMNRKNQ